jgi:hypothetical protein
MLLPDRDPHGWAAKALREAGNSFIAEVRGLDEEALVLQPADDDLCIKELVAHLRDAGDLALRQVRSILEQPNRPLPVWDIDLLVRERDYRSADVMMLLRELRDVRQELATVLWMLSSSEWGATARHPHLGDIDIGTIAAGLARHDLEHLWDVRKIKAQLPGNVRVSDEWDEYRL